MKWADEDRELYDAMKAEGTQEDPAEKEARELAREEELREFLNAKFSHNDYKIRKRRPALLPH